MIRPKGTNGFLKTVFLRTSESPGTIVQVSKLVQCKQMLAHYA